MLDIEFCSELTVAILHGLQNKKDALDDFYLLYEEHFEQEVDVQRRFDASMRRLLDLADILKSSRWRKKSDFYTLFVLLSEDLPGLKDAETAALARILDEFAEQIDETLSRIGREVAAVTAGGGSNAGEPVLESVPGDVATYTLAVRGGASDLSARRARRDALLNYIEAALDVGAEPTTAPKQ